MCRFGCACVCFLQGPCERRLANSRCACVYYRWASVCTSSIRCRYRAAVYILAWPRAVCHSHCLVYTRLFIARSRSSRRGREPVQLHGFSAVRTRLDARGSCCILMLELFLYEPCTVNDCMDALTLPQCLCGMSVLCVNSTAVHVRGTCMHGHARWTGPQRVVETPSFGGVTKIKRCVCATWAYIRSPVHIPRRDTEILN